MTTPEINPGAKIDWTHDVIEIPARLGDQWRKYAVGSVRITINGEVFAFSASEWWGDLPQDHPFYGMTADPQRRETAVEIQRRMYEVATQDLDFKVPNFKVTPVAADPAQSAPIPQQQTR